jgi:hypothetical protein
MWRRKADPSVRCDAIRCPKEATRDLHNPEFSRYIKLEASAAARMERGDPASVCQHHYQQATRPPLPHLMSEAMRSARRIPQPDRGAA